MLRWALRCHNFHRRIGDRRQMIFYLLGAVVQLGVSRLPIWHPLWCSHMLQPLAVVFHNPEKQSQFLIQIRAD